MSEPLTEAELDRVEALLRGIGEQPSITATVTGRIILRLIAEVRYMRGLDAAHRRMVSAIKDLASFASATRRLR